MTCPADYLTEHDTIIRSHVALARGEGMTDEDIVVWLVIRDGIAIANRSCHEHEGSRYLIEREYPELRADYDKPVKSGHVSVVVLSAVGNAVFHVRINK